MELEGNILVAALYDDGYDEYQLIPGDVILRLNNIDIDEVISSMLKSGLSLI